MRYLAALGIAVIAGLVIGAPADSRSNGPYSARVLTPPKVQAIGARYTLKTIVRNQGPTTRPFCIDFTDDNNSWLIEMPGLYSFDSDAWCAGTLKRDQTKTLTAYIIPGKAGVHKMSITIGKAKVFRTTHRIVIDDDDGLYWEGQFVLG